MKVMTEELFCKWVDDCLTPEEQLVVDAAAKDDPSLLEEMASIRELNTQVKAEFPASIEPPYPDFFNTQVMNRIRDEEKKISAPVSSGKNPWWSKIGFGWVPASALAVVLAFFAGSRMNHFTDGPELAQKILPSVYTPEEKHGARVIADSQGDVAAIVMEGLDAIGDEVDFAEANASVALPERYLLSLQRNTP